MIAGWTFGQWVVTVAFWGVVLLLMAGRRSAWRNR
jgi:hypothetical protein